MVRISKLSLHILIHDILNNWPRFAKDCLSKKKIDTEEIKLDSGDRQLTVNHTRGEYVNWQWKSVEDAKVKYDTLAFLVSYDC